MSSLNSYISSVSNDNDEYERVFENLENNEQVQEINENNPAEENEVNVDENIEEINRSESEDEDEEVIENEERLEIDLDALNVEKSDEEEKEDLDENKEQFKIFLEDPRYEEIPLSKDAFKLKYEALALQEKNREKQLKKKIQKKRFFQYLKSELQGGIKTNENKIKFDSVFIENIKVLARKIFVGRKKIYALLFSSGVFLPKLNTRACTVKYMLSVLKRKSYFITLEDMKIYQGNVDLTRRELLFCLKEILKINKESIMLENNQPPDKYFLIEMLFNIAPNFFIFEEENVDEDMMELGVKILSHTNINDYRGFFKKNKQKDKIIILKKLYKKEILYLNKEEAEKKYQNFLRSN